MKILKTKMRWKYRVKNCGKYAKWVKDHKEKYFIIEVSEEELEKFRKCMAWHVIDFKEDGNL